MALWLVGFGFCVLFNGCVLCGGSLCGVSGPGVALALRWLGFCGGSGFLLDRVLRWLGFGGVVRVLLRRIGFCGGSGSVVVQVLRWLRVCGGWGSAAAWDLRWLRLCGGSGSRVARVLRWWLMSAVARVVCVGARPQLTAHPLYGILANSRMITECTKAAKSRHSEANPSHRHIEAKRGYMLHVQHPRLVEAFLISDPSL